MQIKVQRQQADTRAEHEAKGEERRRQQRRRGNNATYLENTCQKMDWTYTPPAQEAEELPYPASTGREFLSSTAARTNFRDNDALLLIPWLEEISSNGSRMNFHLVLYNGRNISEKIK